MLGAISHAQKCAWSHAADTQKSRLVANVLKINRFQISGMMSQVDSLIFIGHVEFCHFSTTFASMILTRDFDNPHRFQSSVAIINSN